MALDIHVRAATKEDCGALTVIEQEAFPDSAWTANDFLKYDCVVAEVDLSPAISGFLVSRETFRGTTDTPPEREILNLAVAIRFRRLGIGRALLECELKRATDVFLEVRKSNAPAIQLYKNAGFIEVSQRPEYYDNPVESAIVMRTK